MALLIGVELLIKDELLTETGRCNKLTQYLTELTKKVVSTQQRIDSTGCEILLQLIAYLEENPNRTVLNELLALLRNLAATSRRSRATLIKSPLNEALIRKVVVENFAGSEASLISCRRLLQYLGNLVGDVDDNLVIWEALMARGKIFKKMLGCEDQKTSLYSAFTLINLARGNSLSRLLDLPDLVELLELLISTVLRHENEWSLLILENVIMSERFAANFEPLSMSSKQFLLDLICEKASHSDSSTFHIPKEFVPLCVRHVKTHLDRVRIDRSCEDYDGGVLLLKMITILAHVSLDHKHALGHDLELLIMCVECLKTVHTAGKQGEEGCDTRNDFESLAGNKTEIFEHPLFGLKRDLVRLIGNMSHQNKLNQDTVRELQGLELLCDLSCLDARNPYIMQWVVLALRNLLENNPENQKVVASFTRQSVQKDSSVLKDLGIQLT
ncbi:ataxin-10-like [Tropilaelaps mercedesae]|uniref:Ataxin-10 n=1 Tax=Tropilaelaps mercedesae TaxID=418985 RepID=A0A1V9XYI8_9ACAR|nr:ataxin-10-like [Tropilaelaps mercedesae]